jgi:broad specificity phosphatase PhoE
MAKGLTKFMNDYKSMTLNELRHYVLEHREDEEAWNEYASRPRPNAVKYPYTENSQEIEDSLRNFLENKDNSQH